MLLLGKTDCVQIETEQGKDDQRDPNEVPFSSIFIRILGGLPQNGGARPPSDRCSWNTA